MFHITRAQLDKDEGKAVEIIPEVRGVASIASPAKTSKLEYEIKVASGDVSALVDHGASYSFVAAEWCERERLPITWLPEAHVVA